MEIKFADLQDAQPILSVLQEHLIDIKNSEVVKNHKNQGFLIRDFSLDQIKNIISDKTANLVLASKEREELLGYLIGCRFSNLPKDLQRDILPCLVKQKINLLEQVIYHRQIAVKSGTKNVGSPLMEKFLQEAKNASYQYVVCRIIHQPINNQKSILFHQRFGFNLIGEVKENGLVAGVYLNKI